MDTGMEEEGNELEEDVELTGAAARGKGRLGLRRQPANSIEALHSKSSSSSSSGGSKRSSIAAGAAAAAGDSIFADHSHLPHLFFLSSPEDNESGRPLRRLRRRPEPITPPPSTAIISLLNNDDNIDDHDKKDAEEWTEGESASAAVGAAAVVGTQRSPIDLISPSSRRSSSSSLLGRTSETPPIPAIVTESGVGISMTKAAAKMTLEEEEEEEEEWGADWEEGGARGLLSYDVDSVLDNDLEEKAESKDEDEEDEEEEEEEEEIEDEYAFIINDGDGDALLQTESSSSSPSSLPQQFLSLPPDSSSQASIHHRDVDNSDEEDDGENDGFASLPASELRARLRSLGLPATGRTKSLLAARLRSSLRAQRLAAFPVGSTERYSDRRGKVNKADLPKGANGRALCRLCQRECPKKVNTFCSPACVHEHRLRTSGSYVRKCLLVRDRGKCALCALDVHQMYLKVRRLILAQGWGGRGRGAKGKEGGWKDSVLGGMQAVVDEVVEGTVLEGKVKVRGLNTNGSSSSSKKAVGGSGKQQRPRRPFNSGLFWHADHIVPVVEGGGLQGLENFRILCVACHQTATAKLRERRAQAKRSVKQHEGKEGKEGREGEDGEGIKEESGVAAVVDADEVYGMEVDV
ncbi:hnh endonuclease [Nannochloropsis oceanica]